MLVSAVLAGDREAFGYLVARYQLPLLALARSRLGQVPGAEDVVQETFFAALKWLRTYDSQYSFRTWLWTILLNQCTRHAQKQARHRGSGYADGAGQKDSAAESLRSPDASPLEQLLARESRSQLHALLARLPEAQSDALRLRFFGGLKFQEISVAMDCSLTTAKVRVKQGLLQLSQWLREGGVVTGDRTPSDLVNE